MDGCQPFLCDQSTQSLTRMWDVSEGKLRRALGREGSPLFIYRRENRKIPQSLE